MELNKPNIFILDDSNTELRYLESILNKSGFNAISSNNKKHFIKLLSKIRANLILLDIVMPESDGYEICKMLKSHPLHKSIPIIFLTALTKNKDIAKGLTYGAVDFITKPFNDEILLLRINSVLNQQKQIEKYDSLFNKMSAGACLFEAIFNRDKTLIDAKILDVNSAFEEVFKKNREEIIGKKAIELIFDKETEWLLRFGEMMHSHHSSRFEMFHTQLNRWFSINSYQVTYDTFAALFDDITDQKKKEDQLYKSEEKYRILADNISDLVWKTDLNFKFTYLSPSVLKVLGFTVAEAMNYGFEEVFTPDSFMLAKQIIKEKLNQIEIGDPRGQAPILNDFELYKKDGTVFWCQISAHFILNKDGIPEEIVGVTRDISKRKLVDKILNDSHHRLKQIFRTSQVGIVLTENKKISYTNKYISDMLGYTSEELISKDVSLLFLDNKDSIAVNREMFSKIENNGNAIIETEFRTKKGEQVSVLMNSSYYNEKNIEEGIISVITDISYLKKVEQELTESQQLLIRQNSEKDRFISILAHDLKNSISGSIQIVEILKSRGAEWAKRDLFLNQLDEHIRVSDNLLNDLVTWGKASLGKETYSPEMLKVCDVFNKVKTYYEPQIKQKKLLFRSACNPEQTIFGDQNMIDAIMRNLISNSIKFTEKEGRITLEATHKAGYTLFCISDTGVGMTKEKEYSLFLLGNLVSENGTEGEHGTGFGLQIVKEYIAIHGGTIWVESEIKKGTKVFFRFPDKLN